MTNAFTNKVAKVLDRFQSNFKSSYGSVFESSNNNYYVSNRWYVKYGSVILFLCNFFVETTMKLRKKGKSNDNLNENYMHLEEGEEVTDDQADEKNERKEKVFKSDLKKVSSQ